MPKKKKWDPAKDASWKEKNEEDKKTRAIKNALVILNVDLHKLEREPKIMPILQAGALRGLDQVISAMRLSADPVILRFMERWERLNPMFKKIVPWEAVALLAGIDTRQLLGAIIIALREQSTMEVKIVALTSYADITRATVRSAAIPGVDGFKDRQLVHTALGFLAPPKGQTINVNMPGSLEAQELREIDPDDIDMNEMFPDLTKTQQKMLED